MQDSKPPMDKEKLSQLMDGEWYQLNPSDCLKGVCADEELRSKWARYHLIRDLMKNEPVHVDTDLVSRICAAIDDEPEYSNITSIATRTTITDVARLSSIDALDGQSAVGTAVEKTASTGSDTAAGSDAVGFGASAGADKQAVSNTDVTLATAAMGDSAGITAAVVGSEVQAAPASHRSLSRTGLAGFALAASVAAVTVLGMNLMQQPSQSTGTGQRIASSAGADTTIGVIDGGSVFSRQDPGAQLPEVDLVSNPGYYWVSPDSLQRVSDEDRLNLMMSIHIENSPTADSVLPYSRLVGYDEINQER